MSFKISRGIVLSSAACAAAVLGLAVAAPATAQPYDANGYATDTSATVGGVTVQAPRRERSWNGAQVDVLSASRTVGYADLDLNTGYGQHELHNRVVRAAADACDELDRQWTRGYVPLDSGADCIHGAVRDAMLQVGGVAY